jgi:polysaccharide export outer membrane protein
MEGASISMHNSLAIPDHRTIVKVVAAGVTFAILAFAQQPAALSQSSGSINYAPTGGAGQNRSTPGTNAQSPMVTVPEDFANLRLAPGYLLNVQIYDEPDFSGPIRVDNEGNISIPFLKSLHVAGNTVEQTRDRIQQMFRDEGILKNPQVTIDVQQFATTSATVLGEVQNPGKVELLSPHSLLEVLGLAGGETSLAGNEVEIKRADASSANSANVYHYSRGGSGDTIRNVMVKPGDTVIVRRAGIVYVLGAVNRPGGYAMQEDGELNVAQAISMAEGLAIQAKTSALRVIEHGRDGNLVNVPVSYKRMMNGKEVPMSLEAGDIVYVPVSKIKAVFTASSTLIGQTTAATIYAVK